MHAALSSTLGRLPQMSTQVVPVAYNSYHWQMSPVKLGTLLGTEGPALGPAAMCPFARNLLAAVRGAGAALALRLDADAPTFGLGPGGRLHLLV